MGSRNLILQVLQQVHSVWARLNTKGSDQNLKLYWDKLKKIVKNQIVLNLDFAKVKNFLSTNPEMKNLVVRWHTMIILCLFLHLVPVARRYFIAQLGMTVWLAQIKGVQKRTALLDHTKYQVQQNI